METGFIFYYCKCSILFRLLPDPERKHKKPSPKAMKTGIARYANMQVQKSLFYCSLLLFFIACDQPKEIVNLYPDGQVREKYFEIKTENGMARHGLYTLLDSTGVPMEESNYENGKLTGIRKLYLNGILQSEETRMEDHYHGPFKAFYPDGSLQLEANYVMDVMTGPVKVYYTNGKIKEIVTFADNVENGPFTEYYENGHIKAEGQYIQNEGPVEDGELKLYDTTGVLFKKMNCEKGKCFTTWQRDTTISN